MKEAAEEDDIAEAADGTSAGLLTSFLWVLNTVLGNDSAGAADAPDGSDATADLPYAFASTMMTGFGQSLLKEAARPSLPLADDEDIDIGAVALGLLSGKHEPTLAAASKEQHGSSPAPLPQEKAAGGSKDKQVRPVVGGLHRAALMGELSLVKAYVENDPDTMHAACPITGETPLAYALRGGVGSLKCYHYLLLQGAPATDPLALPVLGAEMEVFDVAQCGLASRLAYEAVLLQPVPIDDVVASSTERLMEVATEVADMIIQVVDADRLLPSGSPGCGAGSTASERWLPLVYESLLREATHSFSSTMAPSLSVNGAAASGPTSVLRASGAFLHCGLCNHSCLPNATRFDFVDDEEEPLPRRTRIQLRALHDLPAGSEVLISYFPLDTPFLDRRDRLTCEYLFQCSCTRCTVDRRIMIEEADIVDMFEEAEAEDEDGDEDKDELAPEFLCDMFLMRYLCPDETCSGTLAPSTAQEKGFSTDGCEGGGSGSSAAFASINGACEMTCNTCTHVRSAAEWDRSVREMASATSKMTADNVKASGMDLNDMD